MSTAAKAPEERATSVQDWPTPVDWPHVHRATMECMGTGTKPAPSSYKPASYTCTSLIFLLGRSPSANLDAYEVVTAPPPPKKNNAMPYQGECCGFGPHLLPPAPALTTQLSMRRG